MNRLLNRLVNRLLLSGLSIRVMAGKAEVHTYVRRRLVVGLGNPGMTGTRHSIGMAVLGAFAAQLGVAGRWLGDKHVLGEVIIAEVQETQVVLLRPKLLMNINGVSVAKTAGKYNIKPEDILLVHDDLDKPLGKIAIKQGGSARGHNGVRSCVDCLQTDVMSRLRIGIGRPSGTTPVDCYVLGRFSQEEQKILGSVVDSRMELLLSQLTGQQAQSPLLPAGGRQTAQKRKSRELSASPAKESSSGPT